MVRFNPKLWISIFLCSFVAVTVACKMTPYAQQRADDVRQEQARDYDEKENIERRLADLEAGAQPISPEEADALRARVAELEKELSEGDTVVAEIKRSDTNQQVALWGTAIASIFGLGGAAKATLGKSRAASAVEGLQLQVDRGELEVDRLANELKQRISAGEAIVSTKLAQVATLLQAFQQGMNSVPVPPAPAPAPVPAQPSTPAP